MSHVKTRARDHASRRQGTANRKNVCGVLGAALATDFDMGSMSRELNYEMMFHQTENIGNE